MSRWPRISATGINDGTAGRLAMRSKRVALAASSFVMSISIAGCAGASFAAQVPEDARLKERLEKIAAGTDGRLGACALEGERRVACVGGANRFSLQSVMKLVVGAAVMDAVDRKGWRLDEEVILRREDLSLHVQPLARIVREKGEFRTTIGDLVERAVAESDSAATDFLFARLGGEEAIRAFLARAGVAEGLRIDRDERHLQTETTGVTWQPEFVETGRLEEARARLSDEQRRAAFAAYLADERDTATPQAMARFLDSLARGRILSPESTTHFLGVMQRTRTFPTRLRAGTPAGWSVAHKTGTSDDFEGVNAVTNDVGILTAPDGRKIAIAVFLARSSAPAGDRDAIIAAVAREVGAVWER